MRDILAGGVFIPANSPELPFRFNKARARRRIARRFNSAARPGLSPFTPTPQRAQLSLPHLKSAFGSLSVH
jgi:hypothetical protein